MHYIELFVVDVVCINVFWRFNYYRRVHNRVAACWPTAPNAEVALVETNETRKWIIYGSQMTMAGGIADGCCLIIVEERPVVISERERKKKDILSIAMVSTSKVSCYAINDVWQQCRTVMECDFKSSPFFLFYA